MFKPNHNNMQKLFRHNVIVNFEPAPHSPPRTHLSITIILCVFESNHTFLNTSPSTRMLAIYNADIYDIILTYISAPPPPPGKEK